MSMQIGRMDRRLAIQKNTQTSPVPDDGTKIDGWATIATVWGRRIDVSGDETFRGRQLTAQLDSVFEIRYPEDFTVTAQNRVLVDGQQFEIVGAPKMHGRREIMELRCKIAIATTQSEQ